MHPAVIEVIHKFNQTLHPDWSSSHISAHNDTHSNHTRLYLTSLTADESVKDAFHGYSGIAIAYICLCILMLGLGIVGLTSCVMHDRAELAERAPPTPQAPSRPRAARTMLATSTPTSVPTRSIFQRIWMLQLGKRSNRGQGQQMGDVEMQNLAQTSMIPPATAWHPSVSSPSEAGSSITGGLTRSTKTAAKLGNIKTRPRPDSSHTAALLSTPPDVAFPSSRRHNLARRFDFLVPRPDETPPPAYGQHQNDVNVSATGAGQSVGASEQLPDRSQARARS